MATTNRRQFVIETVITNGADDTTWNVKVDILGPEAVLLQRRVIPVSRNEPDITGHAVAVACADYQPWNYTITPDAPGLYLLAVDVPASFTQKSRIADTTRSPYERISA
jgi:hypothetical protein